MYFKNVEIENVGPLSYVNLNFEFDEAGRPKPLVVMGENGSGKTILISYLVNALITFKQSIYDDSEVSQGRVYKARSPAYISAGAVYAYSKVSMTSDLEVMEWQLTRRKKDFEEVYGFTPMRREWNQIPDDEYNFFSENSLAHKEKVNQLIGNQVCLYFPVNRFEEPAWLNQSHLTAQAMYTELEKVQRRSNRSIVALSPLKQNQNWFLDVVLDRQVYDLKLHKLPLNPEVVLDVLVGYSGVSNSYFEYVNSILRVILRKKDIRLGIGPRGGRQVSVMSGDKSVIPNIFQLSTGETQLLNLAMSILRDFDHSDGIFNSPDDIKGVVIIDEVDAHLHTIHQTAVLPELIKLFPNVQFILTTHSPLFCIGIEELLGEDGVTLIEMPTGLPAAASDQKEFIAAYEAFKNTMKFRSDIQSELTRLARPIVFFEGDYDIRYMRKAAELFNRIDLLEGIELKDATGYGNLDKIWRGYDNHVADILPSKLILMYDCDVNKSVSSKGSVHRRVIPSVAINPIKIGIENLFPEQTIRRVELQCPQFIDVVEAVSVRVRGNNINKPELKSVNKDEKRNMCAWLCENGTVEDFEGFRVIFELIEEIVDEKAR